jgi:serine/threonine protein kinase
MTTRPTSELMLCVAVFYVQVAVKILFCMEMTPDRVISFCNEASVLHALKHPNIVECVGVAVMPPAICLVSTQHTSYFYF